jgi:hypothetical protein
VQSAGSNQTPYVSVSNAVYVNPSTGTLYAVSKSFRIPHPTKDGKMLVYGVLEGPENAVYIRGKLSKGNVIELPEYWSALVDMDTMTVSLTSIGKDRSLYVKSVDETKIVIGSSNIFSTSCECYYMIFAERKDIAKLQVEE